MKTIGRMKMTITTIMGWVVNPSAGINNLTMVSHFIAHSFLAVITHTLTTFIDFPAIYMLHCIQICYH